MEWKVTVALSVNEVALVTERQTCSSRSCFQPLLGTECRSARSLKICESINSTSIRIHPFMIYLRSTPRAPSPKSLTTSFNLQQKSCNVRGLHFFLNDSWKSQYFTNVVYYCITFCDYVLFFLWMGVWTSECLATYWGPEFPIFHLVQAKAYDSCAPEDSVSRVSNEDAFLESRLGSSLISTSPRTGHSLGQISQGFLLLRICSSCVWMFAPYKVLHNHI